MLRDRRRQSKAAPNAMKLAWRQSRGGLVIIGIFSIFTNLLRLVTPIYVLQILDRIPASRSVETLVMLTVITVCAIFTGFLLEIMRRRMLLHWGSWIERQFGPKLVHAGLSTEAQERDLTPSKTLRDLATVRSFVSGQALPAWLDVVWAPVFIIVAYLINPLLAAIAFGGLLCVLILGILQEVLTRSSRQVTRQALLDSKEWVATAERNSETVGPLRMAGNVTKRWSEAAFERQDEGLRSKKIMISMNAAIRLMGRLLRISILAVGLWLVIGDVLTLGGVIAAGFLGRMAFQAVQRAMLKWREWRLAHAAYIRLRTALSLVGTSEVSMLDHSMPAPLLIEDLGYRYPNQAASVLKRIGVIMEPGKVLCVIGPSASGKTTFSRLAIGMLRPRYGSIRLGQLDVWRLSQEGQGAYAGYLPQDIRLFRGTVRENIAHMATGDFSQVVEAAKLAGAHDIILKLPLGYDTEISEDEPLLSAGQRKAVALARTFYGWPQLIVMDEPEPHLDRSARRVLTRALKTCASQGSIVIVTSQSRSLTKVADKVILLGGDKIEIIESRDEIDALRSTQRRTRRSA
ncbi:MAG: type I secretion system permease/ATPase [Geminicoccaceae bacterium]